MSTKNKLSDLNNHLFLQLEKLNDEDLDGKALETEIKRANAISSLASNIIGAAKVTVDAMKLLNKGDFDESKLPSIFTEQKQLTAK